MHFQPGATLTTVKTEMLLAQPNNNNFSMEEDGGDIRPSQIDEFVEMRQKYHENANGIYYIQGNNVVGPSSSYITIGDEDPFANGRFVDALTKQLTLKPASASQSRLGAPHQDNHYSHLMRK